MNVVIISEDVVEEEEVDYPSPPPVFLSYQWGHQDEVKLIRNHLQMAGYECWMDIGQMGGGDKLFEKIDNGIRGAQVVICCVSEKYAQSPNCNREVYWDFLKLLDQPFYFIELTVRVFIVVIIHLIFLCKRTIRLLVLEMTLDITKK